MKRFLTFALACAIAAGCSDGNNSGGGQSSVAQSSANATRGGTIAVGEQTWTIVPSTQCSIYPGNVVSIAGHAAEDPSLEIVIDDTTERGPVGVSVGADRREGSWFAVRDTLQWQIEGQQVSGTATFRETRGGNGKSADGSFEIKC